MRAVFDTFEGWFQATDGEGWQAINSHSGNGLISRADDVFASQIFFDHIFVRPDIFPNVALPVVEKILGTNGHGLWRRSTVLSNIVQKTRLAVHEDFPFFKTRR